MRRPQISITSCFFHQISFLFGGILLSLFTPSYRRTAAASPISYGLGIRNVLIARDNLMHQRDDADTSSWLAASSNIYEPNGDDQVVAEHPSDMNDPGPSGESQEPSSEPIPNPQPGPPPTNDPRPPEANQQAKSTTATKTPTNRPQSIPTSTRNATTSPR